MVGDGRCPIVDTWWQTETGGILITPLPGATKLKPGSATLPFFGVQAGDRRRAKARCWRAPARATSASPIAGPARCAPSTATTSASCRPISRPIPGKYFTGDGCRRDADGYYWITGRVDDVINVSGHRMGTAEVESRSSPTPRCRRPRWSAIPHDIKGQGIYAYVTLMAGETASEELRKELVAWVRKEIGPIASPDLIQFAPGLPKTRSGKIMRRILRKIAEDEFGALGDTSTLADPGGGRRPDRQPAEQESGGGLIVRASCRPARHEAVWSGAVYRRFLGTAAEVEPFPPFPAGARTLFAALLFLVALLPAIRFFPPPLPGGLARRLCGAPFLGSSLAGGFPGTPLRRRNGELVSSPRASGPRRPPLER